MPNFEIQFYDDDGKQASLVVRAEHKYAARDHVKTRGGTAGEVEEEGGEPVGEVGVTQLKQVSEDVAVDIDLIGDLEDDSEIAALEQAEEDMMPAGDGGDGGQAADDTQGSAA